MQCSSSHFCHSKCFKKLLRSSIIHRGLCLPCNAPQPVSNLLHRFSHLPWPSNWWVLTAGLGVAQGGVHPQVGGTGVKQNLEGLGGSADADGSIVGALRNKQWCVLHGLATVCILLFTRLMCNSCCGCWAHTALYMKSKIINIRSKGWNGMGGSVCSGLREGVPTSA